MKDYDKEIFNYTFELEYNDGLKMNHTITANSMRSAWYGCGVEVSEMPDQPTIIKFVKLA